MKILECQAVSIRYGRQTALRQLSFDLSPGECLGLVGLNGAGKTSLFKALLDFTEIQQGSIRLFGLPHTQPQSRAQVAFLPEQFWPADDLRGMDFLHYMLRLYHSPQHVQTRAIQPLCAALDLDFARLQQPIRVYSKGIQQKLGLLACLLSGKSLLILDEPFSGLDPKARALARQQLQQHRQAGKTLLFSAHHLEDIEQLCDRLLVLHEGQSAFLGTPQAFLQQFASDHLEQAFLRCIGA